MLLKTLKNIPNVDHSKIPEAFDKLNKIAEVYKNSKIIVDDNQRRSNPKISGARAITQKILNDLKNANSLIEYLPVNVINAVSKVSNAPAGKTHNEIRNAIEIYEKALIYLQAEPDKKSDVDRVILGYEVALVFINVLGVTPTTTSDKHPNLKPLSKGANYAKVLRATLQLAGVQNVDISNLIAKVFRLYAVLCGS
jgi:hypothetical protein